ncbi:hypothetical protein STEG23_028147 [Scotinomys teguina]
MYLANETTPSARSRNQAALLQSVNRPILRNHSFRIFTTQSNSRISERKFDNFELGGEGQRLISKRALFEINVKGRRFSPTTDHSDSTVLNFQLPGKWEATPSLILCCGNLP